MHILKFEAENLKRLKVVSITPKGNLVKITGKNAQGKSSVLDAIWWALAGTRDVQRQPVRAGEEVARIFLDLGSLKVTRWFTATDGGKDFTTKLEVRGGDGGKFDKPQLKLTEIWSGLLIDPLGFARMKPEDQFGMLKPMVKGIDFTAIEAANKADYDERTDVNRRAKDMRAQANAIIVPDGTPDEPVDEQALLNKITSAADENGKIMAQANDRQKVERQLIDEHEDLADIEAKISKLVEEQVSTLETIKTLKKIKSEWKPLPDPVDVSQVRNALDQAKTKNADIAQKARRAELIKSASNYEAQSKELTSDMDERQARVEKAIAAANLPVKGLGLGDGFVTLDGLPFDQASDAQRLRASIAIAMSNDSILKVLRVRDGSLLDSEAMETLHAMADEKGYQVWIETVSDGGGDGESFVLEDGMVKEPT